MLRGVSVDVRQWQRVKGIFSSALEQAPEQRIAFLKEACGEDEALRQEVESLLAAHQDAPSGKLAEAASTADSTPADTDPRSGRRIGPYRVVRCIGQGGMATVYLAVRADDVYKKQVAIKIIPGGLDNQELLRRFRNERQTLATLDHANIVKLLDGGTTEDNLPYLVMDYIDGSPVDEYCDNRRLSTGERLRVFLDVCAAVQYAHQRLVIHRDLKPGNILVTADGTVKLLDFGIAKLLNPEAAATLVVTRTGQRAMTPEYASPEQVRGEPLTNAADVYSLGVVLYELLTGHHLYRSTFSMAEIERAICEEEPVKPSTVVTRARLKTFPDGTTQMITAQEISRRRRETDVKRLRSRLHGDLDAIVMTALRKEPQRRYSSVYEFAEDIRRHLEGLTVRARPSTVVYRGVKVLRRHREAAATAFAFVIVAGLAIVGFRYSHRVHALTEKDTIVLADFTNTTGDPVFDGTLRQGLSVQLEQSPFLSLISEQRIQETLRLMSRPAAARLTPEIAREICERTGSAAVLDGSIASFGSQYVLGLRAVKCGTGDSLAEEQERANGKEQVLAAMDKASEKMRSQLGESLNSIQKYDLPLARVTTPSLEALKAYSQGVESQKRGSAGAIPFFQHAIQLDLSFAIAYQALGLMYSNSGQTQLARQNISKAYELRERTSEREKLVITAAYYQYVMGDLEQAGRTYELLIQSYPREYAGYVNLSFNSLLLGQYENTVTQVRKALELEPGSTIGYSNLAGAYLLMNRPDDAGAAIEEAHQHKLDDIPLHVILYGIAVVKGDMQGMTEQVRWATGKPGADAVLIGAQADAEAYVGHLAAARQLSRQATDAAARFHLNDQAATLKGAEALREALYGNPLRARTLALAALAMSASRDQQALAGLALAFTGEAVKAEGVIENLIRNFPADTIANLYWLPTIRAQVALAKQRSAEANGQLQATATYDSVGFHPCMLYPAYVRGNAYLGLHQGDPAAAEFQKLLSHRSLVLNCPIGALAHLGLGRAFAIAGDREKARVAYADFLRLWNDADADIPVLRQAKAEYAKLQN